MDELENPTFEGPSIANLSSDFDEKVDLNSTTRRRNGLIPRRQKTLEGPYCSDTDSSIIDDSIEAIQLRFNYEHYGGLRPFEQFQRIRNHSYAFDLLRQKRGDAICRELHTFLKTVGIQYPFGVRQTTLERAIQPNDCKKFKNINFPFLEQYFTLTELSKLPGTSTQYMTGGMWVRGYIRTYDEKKYKGLERLKTKSLSFFDVQWEYFSTSILCQVKKRLLPARVKRNNFHQKVNNLGNTNGSRYDWV